MKKLETLGFKHFCMSIGNLPSSYVESLSYYECLLWLIKYLQEEVIPTVNNNSEVVEELQGLYLELKSYVDNYFDNLDVQEEINNKLDEMVEEGTLQEIIADYLNSKAVFGFDTVADMKEATNLIEGSYAKTLGYYSVNDGGSATYKIRTITNEDVVDNASIISLNNSDTLICELIFNEINLVQWGAKGDGINDDTESIQHALDYAYNNKYNVISPENKTYLINERLEVKNLNINLNNATITSNTTIDTLLYMNIIDNTNLTDYYGELNNIKLDCTNADSGIYIEMGRKKLIHNIVFNNIKHYGVRYTTGYEILLKDCHFNGNGTTDTIGIYAAGGDSNFKDCIIIDCYHAIENKGLNFYSGIHAWIRTHAIAPTASMFVCTGNVPAYVDQCYSDTYGRTFEIGDSWIIANQIYVYFNPNIYEDTYAAPYFYYGRSNFSAYYQGKCTLTNSDLRGVSNRASQHLQFGNMEGNRLIKCNYNNLIKVDNYNPGISNSVLTTSTEGVDQISTNKLAMKNGFCNVNLVFRLDTNTTNTFTFSGLGNNRSPNGEVNTMLCWGDNNINAVDGFGYLKITGTTISGKITGTPTNRYVYVKINCTYPIYASESTEY